MLKFHRFIFFSMHIFHSQYFYFSIFSFGNYLMSRCLIILHEIAHVFVGHDSASWIKCMLLLNERTEE